MAFIGMRHVVAAEFDSHTAGSAPSYKSGGWDVGKAINGNLTINRNDNPLRADDTIAEDDNGIIGMDLELGLDDILEDIQAKMGLLKEVTAGSPSVTTYYDTSATSKDVGVGYMRVRRKNGATKYQTVWIYKSKFSVDSISVATATDSIAYQHQTINGVGEGVKLTSGGKMSFVITNDEPLATEAAAVNWLKAKANIGSGT